jgi:putative oxidoreductase
MMIDLAVLHYGADGGSDIVLTINRLALGAFFAISGYHKLFNKERHAALVGTLQELKIPFLWFNQWWVPSIEFLGGLALLSGVLAPLAAMGLIVICLVATCTAGIKRIPSLNPIDKADWLDDLLYQPEVVYILGLLVVLAFGSGPYTVPELLGVLS